jgi:hypothetical protein
MLLTEEQLNKLIEEEVRKYLLEEGILDTAKDVAEGSLLSKVRGYFSPDAEKFTGLAVVWNYSGAAPVTNALKAQIPKEYLDYIPQGHSGLIVVKPNKNAVFIDFGAGKATWGCGDTLDYEKERKGYGLFSYGGFRVISIGAANVKSDGSITAAEAKRLIGLGKVKNANEFGVILNFDTESVLGIVGKKSCSPYSIVPFVPSLPDSFFLKKGDKPVLAGGTGADNCGSMTMRLLSMGTGLIKGSVIAMLRKGTLTPNMVLPILKSTGMLSFSGTR